MYIVANRVPVASPWREQFEERFRTRAGQSTSSRASAPAGAPPRRCGVSLCGPHHVARQGSLRGLGRQRGFSPGPSASLPKEAYTGEGRLEQHEVVIAAEARVTP